MQKRTFICLCAALLCGCGIFDSDKFKAAEQEDGGAAGSGGTEVPGTGGAGTGGATGTGGSSDAGGTSGTGGSAGAGTSGTGGDAGSEAGTGGISGNAGSDAGTGGNSGTGSTSGSGGSAGESPGTGGDAGSGTSGTGGNAGSGAGTGGGSSGNAGAAGQSGQGGTGGSNPCPDATYDDVASALGETCGNLFPSGCGSASSTITREEFITVVVMLIPDKLQGYTEPSAGASFSDVPADHGAEEALWLEIIPATAFFQPTALATTCFVQEVADAVQALPDIYAVVFLNDPDGNVGPTGNVSSVSRFNLYGTSPANHLAGIVRLVNNLDEPPDFTVPQPTQALEAVGLRCQAPDGGSNFTDYDSPLNADGYADFSVDCYSEASGAIEIQIRIDPGIDGAGEAAQIGIDPTTLTVRRGPDGGQETNPRKTVTN